MLNRHRPSATVIEARSAGTPRCYEHMAERLGLVYTSACETPDGLCPIASQFNGTLVETEKPLPGRAPAVVAEISRVVQLARDAAVAASTSFANRDANDHHTWS